MALNAAFDTADFLKNLTLAGLASLWQSKNSMLVIHKVFVARV